jgi:hypothetical protein
MSKPGAQSAGELIPPEIRAQAQAYFEKPNADTSFTNDYYFSGKLRLGQETYSTGLMVTQISSAAKPVRVADINMETGEMELVPMSPNKRSGIVQTFRFRFEGETPFVEGDTVYLLPPAAGGIEWPRWLRRRRPENRESGTPAETQQQEPVSSTRNQPSPQNHVPPTPLSLPCTRIWRSGKTVTV